MVKLKRPVKPHNFIQTEDAVIRSQTDQPNLLIFLHIPKNAGTTLVHVIRRQYPKQSVFWFSYDRPELVAKFEKMDEKERGELLCLGGHIPFGIHEEFKDIPVTYITMLRDPVARFISEYGQLSRVLQSGNWRSGSWRPPIERLKSLGDYLDYRIETNAMEVQTRFIGGYALPPGTQRQFEPLPEDALQRAKDNLRKHFLVTGITQRFDESLLLMKRRLGWKSHIFYARQNTAPQVASYSDIPTELLERIIEHTRIDAELVCFAEELLDEAIAAEGDDFQKELGKLHRVNHTLFTLSNTWKRFIPPKFQNAPGIRHVRALGYKLLR